MKIGWSDSVVRLLAGPNWTQADTHGERRISVSSRSGEQSWSRSMDAIVSVADARCGGRVRRREIEALITQVRRSLSHDSSLCAVTFTARDSSVRHTPFPVDDAFSWYLRCDDVTWLHCASQPQQLESLTARISAWINAETIRAPAGFRLVTMPLNRSLYRPF